MPKPLSEWLHYAAIKWRMPDTGVKLYDGIWHRVAENPPAWTTCGRWAGNGFIRGWAGHGRRWANPSAAGGVKPGELCSRCFQSELPWFRALAEANLVGPAV